MATSELNRLERELKAAAVQLSMAESKTTRYSTVDPAQSASVSEARVVSAAMSALETDADAPIDQVLEESLRSPVISMSDLRQWRAFVVRVRRRLKAERESTGEHRPSLRRGWVVYAAAAVVVVAMAVGVVGSLLGHGLSIPTDSGGCDGSGCERGSLVASALSEKRTEPDAPTTDGPGVVVAGPTPPTASSANTESASTTESGSAPTGGSTDRQGTTATSSPSSTGSDSSTTSTTPSSSADPQPGDDPRSTTTRSTTSTTTGTRPPPSPISATTAAPTTTTRPPSSITTTTVTPTSSTTASAPTGLACPGGGPTDGVDVTNVVAGDVLNVRLGPSTAFAIVFGLDPAATGVQIYDDDRFGSWVIVLIPGRTPSNPEGCGWAHSAFLTDPISGISGSNQGLT